MNGVIRSADGTELAVRCSGAGSPVVLVHGTNGDSNSFALVEAKLAERYSVWVYDRRGRGGSGDARGYDLEREVDDVLAVLHAAGGNAHLVGHSFGAVCCLVAAMRAPDLRSLILYEPPLRMDRVDLEGMRDVQTALDRDDPDRALELFFALPGVTVEEAQTLRASDAVWARLREGVRRAPREVFALHEKRAELTSFDPPGVPILYLYGEKTAAAGIPAPDEIPALLPTAHIQRLPGQRHLAFVFDPDAFAAAILAFTGDNDT